MLKLDVTLSIGVLLTSSLTFNYGYITNSICFCKNWVWVVSYKKFKKMKITNKQASELEALKLYIERNFDKSIIDIRVDYVNLLNVLNFRISINGKSIFYDSEVLAWTFIDGIYSGINR